MNSKTVTEAEVVKTEVEAETDKQISSVNSGCIVRAEGNKRVVAS
jgi:hypothetical protein